MALARGTLARLRGDPAPRCSILQPLADSTDAAAEVATRAHARLGADRLGPARAGCAGAGVASFERALKDFEQLETRPTPARADAQLGLGRAHLAQGDSAKALALLDQADAFWRGFDPSNRRAALAADALARAKASPSR